MTGTDEYTIVPGTAADLDELSELWLALLSHHRNLLDDRFPVHAPTDSWELARAAFARWLADDAAIARIARRRDGGEVLGFGICQLLAGGPTFDLGSMRGDLDTLVVKDAARGGGVGAALIESIRAELAARGIAYWSVGLLAGNEQAEKLYRRLGFAPWTQTLLARTDR